MDQKERTLKDLDKLKRIITIAKELGLESKYQDVLDHAQNYFVDAKHFYDSGDYFTSFGAANYAYCFIDAILIIEGKRDQNIL